MTHHDLVVRACRWLRTRRCAVIVWKRNATADEQPDALGFDRCGRSYLVECKTSRKDFFADRKKPHRGPFVDGMGQYRFYFTPEGLVALNELPQGWGLVEVLGRSVITAQESDTFVRRNHRQEIVHLVRQVLRPDGFPPAKIRPRKLKGIPIPRPSLADIMRSRLDRPADVPFPEEGRKPPDQVG